ncbi:hypothetical protein [Frondihabitans peucedani]|uniref:Integrase catalytic domain-containing protein n=1 Tax=Frondihabitans peucedani TaxID=598626 RepID=A0ABP8E1V8_9MICO
MTADVAYLGVGTQLEWEGQPATVHRMSMGYVTLLNLEGRELAPVPMLAVVQAITSDENPPLPAPLLHGIKSRLSKWQRKQLRDDRDLFSRLDNGVSYKAHLKGRRPQKSMDPDRTTLDHRIGVVARRVAKKRKIDDESARRYIRRRLNRRPGGLATLINAKYLQPRSHKYDPRLDQLVEKYLDGLARSSTIPGTSIYLRFVADTKEDRPDIDFAGFSLRTFQRSCQEIYRRRPSLKLRAATRRSAQDRNKATHARRVATRPGELWLADTTKLNVLLWDPDARDDNDTFRPELTLLIDLATRLICGYSITTTTTGFGIGLAMASALASMVDPELFIEVDGMTLPRPFVGVPKALANFPLFPESLGTDNGRNYLSIHQVAQMERLQTDFEPARSLSPDDKAQIERTLGSSKTMFESLAQGFTSGSVDERGEDPAAEAVVTYQEFFRRLDRWITIYNFRIHSGLHLPEDPRRELSPYEMWAHLVQETGVAEVPRWNNEWLYFLPNWAGTISTDGVSFGGLMYNAPILETIKRTVPTLNGLHQFYRNPADMRRIYCFDAEGSAYEIPWAHLNEDTPVFGDYLIGRVKNHMGRLHFSQQEYNAVMIEFLRDTIRIDKVNRKARSIARPLSEELLDYNISRVRAADEGTIHKALAAPTQDSLDSIDPAPRDAPPAEDDELEQAIGELQ